MVTVSVALLRRQIGVRTTATRRSGFPSSKELCRWRASQRPASRFFTLLRWERAKDGDKGVVARGEQFGHMRRIQWGSS